MFGVIAIVIATFFGTAKDLVSKGMSQDIHGTVSACTSFLFALPLYCLILLVGHILDYPIFEYTGQFILFICIRAVTDSFSELFKMHALACGEISFILNFFSLSSVFLLFLAPIITGDTISDLGLVGVLIIIFGTLLLLKGPSGSIPWKGVGLALVSAFFSSLNMCFARLAVQQANPIFSGFAMTLISGVILLIPMIKVIEWKEQVSVSSRPLFIRGILEVLFMISKLFGLQYLEAQYVSGIQKLTLVFSVAIGGKAFHEHDQKKRILTSLLIVVGSVLIVWSKVG